MAAADDRVDLTELDVITRYSLAVRTATADRAELVAALRADLEWLEGGRPARRSRATGTQKRATRSSRTTSTSGRRTR
jgi:hypothetical protein